MKFIKLLTLAMTLSVFTLSSALHADDLVNLNFEQGLEGWKPIWSRDPNGATATLDTAEKHGGTQSVKIVSTSTKDWAFLRAATIKVTPGEKYEWKAWIKFEPQAPKGNATLCVIAWDADKKAKDFMLGKVSANPATKDWQELRAEFTVPEGCIGITPRIVGGDLATLWIDDFSLTKK